jgi:hypothetical protein
MWLSKAGKINLRALRRQRIPNPENHSDVGTKALFRVAYVSRREGIVSRKPQNTNHATTSTSIIPTGGEIFDDGTIVELVEDPRQGSGLALLKWDGCKSVLSSEVVHEGRTYVPLTLDPTVRRALRLPSHVSSFGSTETLFQELVALTGDFTDLAEPFRQQLVAVVFASWAADCLPTPINLSLWSPSAVDGARVLLFLSCLCRLALALAGPDAADLRALPDQLPATLLIFRPASSRRVRELLTTSGWRGFHSGRSGRLVETIGVRVFSTDVPLGNGTLGPIIEIPVAPRRRRLPTLDAKKQREIAEEFQPRLLQYRLTHCGTAKSAKSDDVSSAGSTSELVSGLRACFSDAPRLSKRLSVLIEAEQSWDDARLGDPRVVLLEVLLARCHEEGRSELYVAEIAADVNAALFVGSGTLTLSPRLVGSLLNSVGLLTHRLGKNGRGLKLDLATRRAIHRLAGAYNVPSAQRPFQACAECAQAQDAEA